MANKSKFSKGDLVDYHIIRDWVRYIDDDLYIRDIIPCVIIKIVCKDRYGELYDIRMANSKKMFFTVPGDSLEWSVNPKTD